MAMRSEIVWMAEEGTSRRSALKLTLPLVTHTSWLNMIECI